MPRSGHGGARPHAGGARAGAGRPRKPLPPPAAAAAPSEPRWYALQTTSQGERLAGSELARQGYRAYSPLQAISRRDAVIPSMFHRILVPRFPGYSFVSLVPGEQWAPLLSVPGIRAVLRGVDHRPTPIPVGEIEYQQSQDAKLCNLMREMLPLIAAGTAIVITDGAFADRVAVVKECNGLAVKVELQAFGRLVDVWLDRASVAEVAGVPATA